MIRTRSIINCLGNPDSPSARNEKLFLRCFFICKMRIIKASLIQTTLMQHLAQSTQQTSPITTTTHNFVERRKNPGNNQDECFFKLWAKIH